MLKNEKKVEERASDPASIEMILKAETECIDTCFSRVEMQTPTCKFGKEGICCRICYMGPCRITTKAPHGVCGADKDTIVARNFLRSVVGGAAAHSDHGRHLILLLKQIARGESESYVIKDEEVLRHYARFYGIDEFERNTMDVALDLANMLLKEFSSQEEPLKTLGLSPKIQQSLWKEYDIIPVGIDRTIVESMHRTHIGVDHDYRNLIRAAFKTAIADGWGGSRLASIGSDIIFGTPYPILSSANLGVLEENSVNIIVHGHEPALSEMLAIASQDPEILEYAESKGADGVVLAGICCTANEILMRHGIPVAGNFLQQELAIITGVVEVMIIDLQCVMPSLPDVASHYHTKVISTLKMAQTIGAEFVNFSDSLESAKDLIKIAIDNFKNRDPRKVKIPSVSKPIVAGFSVKAIKHMLGGTFRGSFRPLNDAIIQGRIKGIVAIVGCNNARMKLDDYINKLTLELIKRDVLILKTGCAAISSAKSGLLLPEAALEKAGNGLKEVCEAIGIPPVLHMGSCVDNSRILEAATEIVLEGGLGDDLSQIPAVGVAPEWMSEKAITIGCYFVASGIDVILGHPFSIEGSENVTGYLNKEISNKFGASFHVCEEPDLAVNLIMKIINDARENLGINKKKERKLYDMKDRRKAHG